MYKADEQIKMVATTNYPTLEELEDGEGIVKEEEPEEKKVVLLFLIIQ